MRRRTFLFFNSSYNMPEALGSRLHISLPHSCARQLFSWRHLSFFGSIQSSLFLSGAEDWFFGRTSPSVERCVTVRKPFDVFHVFGSKLFLPLSFSKSYIYNPYIEVAEFRYRVKNHK